MKKSRKNRGFTLAELLIVIAIIAVLIAIAVPVFSTSMKRAQKATDDANFRNAKSAAVTAILSGTIEAYDSSGNLVPQPLGKKHENAGTPGMGTFYYLTDGHFIPTDVTPPAGVDYVTAKYTAEGDEEGYIGDGSHVKGARIYVFCDPTGNPTFGGQGFDDQYILDSSFGMVFIGFSSYSPN